MKEVRQNKPPVMALKFFRWFCHPSLREAIEGDLEELYHKNNEKFGSKKATGMYCREVLSLLRPSVIVSIHHLLPNKFSNMKKFHWLQLVALNVLVITCILLPFLPGPYDTLSLSLSMAAQLSGYIGLLLVPIGALWLIQEIKKRTGKVAILNNWRSGYYYAITATVVCVLFSVFFALILLMSMGISACVIALSITAIILYRQVAAIRKLKHSSHKIFNTAPLYFLSVPLIAFSVCSFFVSPVSDYSRNYAIKQGQQLVAVIENYKAERGTYPPSIESIKYVAEVPKPSVMGISEFIYELNGDSYNLAFVQHQHIGATREVVMYNRNDEHNVKGYFAKYDAKQPHWKYYWLD
ncbi:MAG: permease prefix domain 2-containing transporter [Bacteroidota bacterium]